jgi:WD40 repeat protein
MDGQVVIYLFARFYISIHSASGKYLLMGMEDGSVRIQPLRNDDIGLMGPYWSINIHDNNYGKITHLSTSHDDKYLFTVGEDGNFFVFELMEEGKIEERVAAAKAKIPSAKVCV